MEYVVVLDSVRNIVANNFHIDKNEISLDTEYVRDLKADSVDLLSLILAFEDAFNIKIDFTKRMLSISDSVNIVMDKMSY